MKFRHLLKMDQPRKRLETQKQNLTHQWKNVDFIRPESKALERLAEIESDIAEINELLDSLELGTKS